MLAWARRFGWVSRALACVLLSLTMHGLAARSNAAFGPCLVPNFGSKVAIDTGSLTLGGLVAADFNRDGRLDIVASTGDGSGFGGPTAVSLFLGDGTGGLGAPRTFPAGARPQSVAIGDFNRDGALDIAAPNGGDLTVAILPGNGAGSFGAPVAYPGRACGNARGIRRLQRRWQR